MPIILLALLVAVSAVSPAGAAARDGASADFPAMVLLVRHAEKAAEPHDDPPLTTAGRERAKALAAALGEAGVTAIVTSDRLRTRETAAPIARRQEIQPVEIGRPEGTLEGHIAAVVSEVRRHPGGVVLVVGHGDTLPAIIAALGGPRVGAIDDDQFDNLFVLTGGPQGVRLVRTRYGAASRRP